MIVKTGRTTVITISHKHPIYGTSVIPDYAERDFKRDLQEYTPWIVLHTDTEQLEQEVLQRHYEDFLGGEDSADFSEFFPYLEEKGYVVVSVFVCGLCVIDTGE